MPMDQLNWKIIVGTSAIAIAFAAIVYRFAKTADPKQSTVADNIKKQKDTSTTATQQTQEVPRTGSFNPGLIISQGVSSKKTLPKVESLGEITLLELNKY
eukprot:150652_1